MSFLKQSGIFFTLLLVITLADYLYLGKPAIGIDDANIFFTYAKHFAQGEGFVFNTGGEKVEGFTSLLWVLACSAFFSLFSHPEVLILLFLLLVTSLTVTLVYREVKKDMITGAYPVVERYFIYIYSLFIICIGPSLVAWSILSMMENALWQLLFVTILVLVLQVYRHEGITGKKLAVMLLSAALLMITRPEGLAWALFFTVILAWCSWKNKKSYLVPVAFFASALISTAGLTWFRLQYFGYPLPNTFYAKVSANHAYNITEGLKYAMTFITGFHTLVTFFIAVLVIAAVHNVRLIFRPGNTSQEKTLNRVTIVSSVILTAIALPLTTGGDHFGGFRFYQGVLPLFAWGIPALSWLVNESLAKGVKTARISLKLVLIAFLLLTSADTLYSLKNFTKRQLNFEFQLAAEGRTLAAELNHFWPSSSPSVGIITVGGFGYAYAGATIDLMGLNNTLMGHSPGERMGIKNHAAFNKEIFYRLQPELLLPRTIEGEKEALLQYVDLLNLNNFENRAMKNIFNDTAFQNQYKPVLVTNKDTGKHIFSFSSAGMLNTMKADNRLTVKEITL
jgi:arabinofuranosyltransferase